MVMESLINPKTGQPYVQNVRRKVIDKHYDWGLYVYKNLTVNGSQTILAQF